MKKILIVGDPSDLSQWRGFLDGLPVGFSITATANPQYALELLEEEQPDVIIADDSEALMVHAKRLCAGIKRVLFTKKLATDKAIADIFLPYPCERKELRAAINELLELGPAAA